MSPQSLPYCQQCGAQVPAGSKFCQKCGAPAVAAAAPAVFRPGCSAHGAQRSRGSRRGRNPRRSPRPERARNPHRTRGHQRRSHQLHPRAPVIRPGLRHRTVAARRLAGASLPGRCHAAGRIARDVDRPLRHVSKPIASSTAADGGASQSLPPCRRPRGSSAPTGWCASWDAAVWAWSTWRCAMMARSAKTWR